MSHYVLMDAAPEIYYDEFVKVSLLIFLALTLMKVLDVQCVSLVIPFQSLLPFFVPYSSEGQYLKKKLISF